MSKRTPNPYRYHPILGKRPKRPPTVNEMLNLIDVLVEHHGIKDPQNDPYALFKLLCYVASNAVPAFQPEGKRGAAQQYSIAEREEIVEDFIRLEKIFTKSARKNSARIAEQRGSTPEAVRKIYNTAKDYIPKEQLDFLKNSDAKHLRIRRLARAMMPGRSKVITEEKI
jgi:hypothetical protein